MTRSLSRSHSFSPFGWRGGVVSVRQQQLDCLHQDAHRCLFLSNGDITTASGHVCGSCSRTIAVFWQPDSFSRWCAGRGSPSGGSLLLYSRSQESGGLHSWKGQQRWYESWCAFTAYRSLRERAQRGLQYLICCTSAETPLVLGLKVNEELIHQLTRRCELGNFKVSLPQNHVLRPFHFCRPFLGVNMWLLPNSSKQIRRERGLS